MRVLLLIILLCNPAHIITAQIVDMRHEVKNGKFALWVKNNLPCESQIYAETPSLNRQFHQYLPKGKEKQLLTVPVDSIQDIEQFKQELTYTFVLGDNDATHDPDYQYMLPYPAGKAYKLIQGYHGRHSHNTPSSEYAYDFKMPEGSMVTAVRGGAVGYVKDDSKKGGSHKKFMGRGNFIMICHDDGTLAVYAHLKYKSALVNIGEHVFAGEVIGFSGNTGYTTGPHLHFAVLAGDRSIPIRFRNLPDTLIEGRFYRQGFEY